MLCSLVNSKKKIHSNRVLVSLDSHYFFTRSNNSNNSSYEHDKKGLTMDNKDLHCSQYKDVDRSTMGTASTTDKNGATVRRSTRERAQ